MYKHTITFSEPEIALKPFMDYYVHMQLISQEGGTYTLSTPDIAIVAMCWKATYFMANKTDAHEGEIVECKI
jgi:hypothetical protein